MATVLPAEDDGGVRELMGFMLAGAGHTVLACGDGEKVLAPARAHRPGIAVRGVGLPGRRGLEVRAAVRADPATAATPVLPLTARDRHGDVAEGCRAGATGYVTFAAGRA